jgi:mono/diheme cytochrome c family protein
LFILFFSANSVAAVDSVEKPYYVGKINAGALYNHWCAQCHGLLGKADGINSTPDMAINPRDFTDKNFMVTRSDKQFDDVIRGGGTRAAKSPLMPPWEETLNDAEIDALVVYLRVLCKCEYEGVVSHEKLRGVDPNFK